MGDGDAVDDHTGHIKEYIILISDIVDNVTCHITGYYDKLDNGRLGKTNGIVIT